MRGLSIGAIEALVAHGWPGNLRELRAACDHAAAVAPEPFIRADDLPDDVLAAIAGRARPSSPRSLSSILSAVEGSVLGTVLVACDGRLTTAGAMLRVPLRTLRRKCASHRLRARDFHPKR